MITDFQEVKEYYRFPFVLSSSFSRMKNINLKNTNLYRDKKEL